LVPNLKGLERAIEVNVSRIAIFTAASEAFTQKNINMTIAQSLDVFEQIVLAFRKEQPDGWVRGYVSTAFECPYSGKVDHESVQNVVDRLLAMGVDEISIGDTTGVASPTEVRHLTRHLLQTIPITKLAYHFHDTHGTAIANTMSALDLGIRAFDSSAAGLGGCPYAPGAAGNLATEDLVYLLEREGLSTGINLDSLSKASIEVLAILGRHPVSKSQIAQFSASETSPK
jgi:isopropylmalate/homocitrate/citramalate synthase